MLSCHQVVSQSIAINLLKMVKNEKLFFAYCLVKIIISLSFSILKIYKKISFALQIPICKPEDLEIND